MHGSWHHTPHDHAVKSPVIAIVPAAGSGRRFGPHEVKTYRLFLGRPLIIWPLEVLQNVDEISQIILVVREPDIHTARDLMSRYSISKVTAIVPGGEERQDSVYQALKEVRDTASTVLVHDGARPLLEPELVQNALASLSGYDGVVAGVPPKDTVKQAVTHASGESGAQHLFVQKTLDRPSLWAVQTPQVFRYEVIRGAYEHAYREGFRATDDAALVERCGGRVRIIMGAYRNIKITTPDDLVTAEALYRKCVSD